MNERSPPASFPVLSWLTEDLHALIFDQNNIEREVERR